MASTEENMPSGVLTSTRLRFCGMTSSAVHTRHPKNIAELKQFCKEEWSKMPPDRCAGLIRNYRKCLVEVIAAKGGSTRVHILFPPCTECLHGVFNKDIKTNCLCVISLRKLCVYCCGLDEDQIKLYDQFMLKSR